MQLILLTVLLHALIAIGKTNTPDFPLEEFYRFKTEPTFRANRVRIVDVVEDKSLLQPGYIFIGPVPRTGAQLIGPQIFDIDGQLIWYGNSTTSHRTQNFHACNYLGEDGRHLCWSEVDWDHLGAERSSNRIFSGHYNQQGQDYGVSAPLRSPNPHEFFVLPGGKTFLQSVYQLKKIDLTPYEGPLEGYVEDGCFQEIDVVTGNSIFNWCGLDSLELWHTSVYLNIPENVVNHTGEPYGDGSLKKPWDYFHLNSVDKTPEGDYVVSARHLDQILKIAGNNNARGIAPGNIIWRLGGKFNSFTGADTLDLSKQHHARVVSTSSNETTLSLFNNQWRTRDYGRRISNAQVVIIDEHAMSVRDVQKYYQPEGQVSFAQGSTQLFDSGNVFVGWGTVPHVSEFKSDGTLLAHIHLSNYNETGTIMDNQQNYRSFKFSWVGEPRWDPKLLAYSHSCNDARDSPLMAHVSWNGATEVTSWRFHTSWISQQGPWTPAGTYRKDGFETTVALKEMFGRQISFRKFVKVEALDMHRKVLAMAIAETFVPMKAISDSCDAESCPNLDLLETPFVYDSALSCAETCHPPSWISRRFFLLLQILVVIPGGILTAWRLYKRHHLRKLSRLSFSHNKKPLLSFEK